MTKKQVNKWCSRYIRLRDALEFCKRRGIDLSQFVRVEDVVGECCTCSKVISWIRGDAGHFISRGSGGGSGVYFDERNIHLQCTDCNCFHQGRGQSYYSFMLKKYGEEVIDELKFLDKNNSYKRKLIGLGLYYKQKYEELVREFEGS